MPDAKQLTVDDVKAETNPVVTRAVAVARSAALHALADEASELTRQGHTCLARGDEAGAKQHLADAIALAAMAAQLLPNRSSNNG